MWLAIVLVAGAVAGEGAGAPSAKVPGSRADAATGALAAPPASAPPSAAAPQPAPERDPLGFERPANVIAPSSPPDAGPGSASDGDEGAKPSATTASNATSSDEGAMTSATTASNASSSPDGGSWEPAPGRAAETPFAPLGTTDSPAASPAAPASPSALSPAAGAPAASPPTDGAAVFTPPPPLPLPPGSAPAATGASVAGAPAVAPTPPLVLVPDPKPADALRSPADAPRSPADALRSPADAPRSPGDAPRSPADALRSPADAPRSPADAPRSPADAPEASVPPAATAEASESPDPDGPKSVYETIEFTTLYGSLFFGLGTSLAAAGGDSLDPILLLGATAGYPLAYGLARWARRRPDVLLAADTALVGLAGFFTVLAVGALPGRFDSGVRIDGGMTSLVTLALLTGSAFGIGAVAHDAPSAVATVWGFRLGGVLGLFAERALLDEARFTKLPPSSIPLLEAGAFLTPALLSTAVARGLRPTPAEASTGFALAVAGGLLVGLAKQSALWGLGGAAAGGAAGIALVSLLSSRRPADPANAP